VGLLRHGEKDISMLSETPSSSRNLQSVPIILRSTLPSLDEIGEGRESVLQATDLEQLGQGTRELFVLGNVEDSHPGAVPERLGRDNRLACARKKKQQPVDQRKKKKAQEKTKKNIQNAHIDAAWMKNASKMIRSGNRHAIPRRTRAPGKRHLVGSKFRSAFLPPGGRADDQVWDPPRKTPHFCSQLRGLLPQLYNRCYHYTITEINHGISHPGTN
jgi:hypothetical protein